METELIIGLTLVVAALAGITFLVVWGKRSIDRIARKGYGSAREIDREEMEERGER